VRFSPPYASALMCRGPPAPGALMAGSFGLFLLPPALLPDGGGSSGGGGGGRIHGAGELSFFFGGEVVLEASGVQRSSRGRNLKRVAGVETSCPSAGIGATAQYPYSEETCHHDGLTHRASLRRSPFRLASRGHATCSRPLHLHMVL
jgi:hypothetical protein